MHFCFWIVMAYAPLQLIDRTELLRLADINYKTLLIRENIDLILKYTFIY